MPRPLRNLNLSEDDVKMWFDRIHEAERFVKDLREKSAAFRAAFHGSFPKPFPNEADDEQVFVNRVHRVVMQWIGVLYAGDPRVKLAPPWNTPTVDRRKVALDRAILNMEIRRAGLEEPAKRALQSALLDGWGWLKSGFHAEFDYEAEEIADLSTNADAEEHGFELGPQFYPPDVLVSEDHEEHEECHRKGAEQDKMRLSMIIEKAQQAMMLAQQQQMQGMGGGAGGPGAVGAPPMPGGMPPQAPRPPLPPGVGAMSMMPPQAQPPILPEIQQEIMRLQQKIAARDQHLELHAQRKIERDRAGRFPTNARVVAESCWVDCVHNSNVVWDCHATGTHDWRWVAERMIRPLMEFKEHPKFKHKDEMQANYARAKPGTRGELNEDASPQGTVESAYLNNQKRGESLGDSDHDDPDALCSVWKVWDIEHRRVIYLHEPINDKALAVEEWPHKYLKAPPLRMIYFELQEDGFTPVSPVSHFYGQQLEINRYRTKASIITRRLSRVALIDKRVPSELVTDIANAEDGSIIPVETFSRPAREIIFPIEWGQVPVDVYQNAAVASDDIQVDTGLGEVALGSGIAAKTATAASVQRQNSAIPIDLKADSLKRVLEEIISDLRALMRQYYTQERYVELFWEGAKTMESWKGSDLLDFDVEVTFDGSDTEEQEVERMQRQQAAEFLTKIPGVDLRKVAEWVLEAYNVGDTSQFFIDQTTQMAQQLQAGVGPGKGQNQQEMPGSPGNMPGTGGGAVGQPAADLTKA